MTNREFWIAATILVGSSTALFFIFIAIDRFMKGTLTWNFFC